jgi:carbon monoxide dehydrogenase subunit G
LRAVNLGPATGVEGPLQRVAEWPRSHHEEDSMSISVPIELGYEFEVRSPFDKVFAVLSDVPRSASHFPKVDRLTDLGDGVYQWEMQKVGTAQVNLQTIYASKYVSDPGQGSVRWSPVKGVGNAQVGGSWKLTDHQGKSTKCVLKIDGTVDVPLPGLMKAVVAPVIEGEFEKAVEKYIDNLIQAFGGEV